MPRIFKMSKFLLKLYVPSVDKIQDLKLFIYTDNYDLAAEISEGIKVEGNIVNVVVDNYAVCNLNDGIINYIAKGNIEGGEYIFERQSNYYLKSPSDYASCDIIDITKKFIDGGEGIMTLTASDFDADGFGSVKIDATEYGEEKYEEGQNSVINSLQTLNVTENGTYEGAYNEVNVNVPQEGGGSVDNEEIEKIWGAVNANDIRIADIELTKLPEQQEEIDSMNLNILDFEQRFIDLQPNIYTAKSTATAANTLYAYEVWEIAEMVYSTSNIVSTVFLDGSMYEVRIFGRKFTSFGVPNFDSRLIWGFLCKPSTTPNLYMVSWEATQDDVNNSKNSVPTISKIF